ncbi:MAG: ABC transporter permease [Beijerinckiaceae bacterium]|nr:ABC transporter permease [Beijerinckiaceae bacterium]
MWILIIRRLVGFLATLAVASILVFFLLEILPGDPAQLILGTDARPDTLLALRHEMGLDQPILTRLLQWIGELLTGNLGMSHTYHVPVATLIGERLPVSLPLALISLLLAIVIGIPGGILAAMRRDKWLDRAVRVKTQILLAIPNFWLAMLLVFVFAITLHWLPAGGFSGWRNIPNAISALVLPAVALAAPQAAILARVTRAALIENLDDVFILAARARGLTASAALFRHALPNAMISVLSIMGLQFSFLLAGTIIIENVFYLPGLGRLIFQAVNQRDLAVVSGVSMLLIASTIVVTFLVDLTALIIDPRLRR